ncbi:MAG TPA: CotH kinase family protein [Flavobacteriales bacterium]|nr:CotH kinase family protein [Flavobacteriales bacterium]HRJ39590.1 CotH kinase family protein [Flavobacteriales bacterium]
MAISLKTRKRIFYSLLAGFALLVAGAFFANRWVKTKGYSNLWEFITTTSSNYGKSFNATYETLSITLDDDDFAKLEGQRQRALEQGIMTTEDDRYVNALLDHNGTSIRAELRLKGHMTDHLQDKKWSFRIKTKKGDAFMGMKRFSLQHPGTRNYVHEWIYHRMMEEEGIVALRYFYLRVKVNGDDWGVYALEEHFTQEMVEHNDRLPGPLIRYNPDLYWVYRVNELHDVRIHEEYAQMQSSYFEAYESKSTLKDSAQRQLFINAVDRLEAFRTGKMKTSEVFDIEKLARFHAIVDVVGGHHSLDWSDVKFYFNPETQLIEPVAYESFSVRDIQKLAGSFRFTGEENGYTNEHHDLLFNDTAFFAAYVRTLDRIATKDWLDNFFARNNDEIESHLAILYGEFAYKKYTTSGYYKNVEKVKALLAAPKYLYAHLEGFTKDSLYVSVAGIDALPAMIHAIIIDSMRVVLPQPVFISCKQNDEPVHYKQFAFVLPSGSSIGEKSTLKVEWTLPGRTELLEQEIAEYPAWSESRAEQAYLRRSANISEFSSVLQMDEANKKIYFKQGKLELNKDLIFPSGYSVIVLEGTRIQLNHSSRIISFSPMRWNGTEEMPVIVESTDGTGEGIILQAGGKKSTFSHVLFRGLHRPEEGGFLHKAVVNLYESPSQFSACEFSEITGAGLSAVRSAVQVNSCRFADIKRDAIRMLFSNFSLTDVVITKVGDDAVSMNNSFAQMRRVKLKKVKGKGIIAEDYSGARIFDLVCKDVKTAVDAFNGSDIVINGAEFRECKTAVKAHSKGQVFGPSSVVVTNAVSEAVEQLSDQDKGSTIQISEKKSE